MLKVVHMVWVMDNAFKFNSTINQHINKPGIQAISGTYRGNPVIHYLDPKTGLNVISSPSGEFISGWKLNPIQVQTSLHVGRSRRRCSRSSLQNL